MEHGAEKIQRWKILILVAVVLAAIPASTPAQNPHQDTEWPSYGGRPGGERYRPLDQINASNFNDWKSAWRIKTDNFRRPPKYKLGRYAADGQRLFYAPPIAARGNCAGPGNGELLWIHGRSMKGKRGGAAPRQLSGRGLAYCPTQGRTHSLCHARLSADLPHAKKRNPCSTFGDKGEV